MGVPKAGLVFAHLGVLLLLNGVAYASLLSVDEKSNVLFIADEGKNISMHGAALHVNGVDVLAAIWGLAATNEQLRGVVDMQNQSLLQQNQSLELLREEAAFLKAIIQTQNDTLVQLQGLVARLANTTLDLARDQSAAQLQTDSQQNMMDVHETKLAVLQPTIQQSCSQNPSVALPMDQQIDTSGAADWEFFSIGNTSYLAVANHFNGTSYNIKSNIYRFDATAPVGSQAVLVQQIDTNGAFDWEYFSIGNTSYLAVANNFNGSSGTSYNIKSNIYRFDATAPVGLQAVLVQQIDTSGAADLEFFSIGNTSYLAVANLIHGSLSYNIKSNIYRFDSVAACWDVY